MRFIAAPISLSFSELNETNQRDFKKEFDSFAESDDDPISQWLKMAKARGETRDTDQILLFMIMELHRKVDQIANILNDEIKTFLELEYKAVEVEGIIFENFKLEQDLLQSGRKYYGRIHMPTFPQREVSVYFKAVAKNIAKITLMHDRDNKEWDSYVAARERIMIRKMKSDEK